MGGGFVFEIAVVVALVMAEEADADEGCFRDLGLSRECWSCTKSLILSMGAVIVLEKAPAEAPAAASCQRGSVLF